MSVSVCARVRVRVRVYARVRACACACARACACVCVCVGTCLCRHVSVLMSVCLRARARPCVFSQSHCCCECLRCRHGHDCAAKQGHRGGKRLRTRVWHSPGVCVRVCACVCACVRACMRLIAGPRASTGRSAEEPADLRDHDSRVSRPQEHVCFPQTYGSVFTLISPH